MATQSYLQYLQPITLGSGEKHFQTLEEIAGSALRDNYGSKNNTPTKRAQIIQAVLSGASDDSIRKMGVSNESIPSLKAYALYYSNPQGFAQNELQYLKENLLDKEDEFGNKSTATLADLKDEELNTILDTYSKLQKLPGIQSIANGLTTAVGPGGTTAILTNDSVKQSRQKELNNSIGKIVNSELGSGYNAGEIIKKIDSGEINSKAMLQSYIYSALGKKYGERLSNSPTFKSLNEDFSYYKGSGIPGNTIDLTSYDFPTTQRAITDILKDRAYVASSKAETENFLNTAPDELATERDAFFSGQRKRATDYLSNEFLPSTVEDVGVTGRPMSYVGDILASKAGELESTISSSQADQEAQDAALFADMAYQKTYQDLITARGNASAQVASDRANLKTTQTNSFTARQNDLNRSFDLKLFEQENANALKNYTSKINKASSTAKSASEANTFAQLGQTAATVGSAAVLAKIPGALG